MPYNMSSTRAVKGFSAVPAKGLLHRCGFAAVQLSMHSIREMCAVDDMSHTYNHFCAFFKDFSALDASIDVDNLPLPNIEGTITDVPCNHMH